MVPGDSPVVRSEPLPSPTPTEPRKRRGIFSFLFKSALGCTAFAFGAFLVLVLLLPTMASRTFVAAAAEGFFEDTYQGSLKVEHVRLAWFKEQSLEGVVLLDPDGHEVARVTATLPSIVRLINWQSGHLGRIRVAIEGDLVADDQGVTNLQRALAPRVPATQGQPTEDDSQSSDEMLANLDLDLALEVRRLTWSDAETRRVGTPFEVHDLVATVTVRPGAPLRVECSGKLVSDPPGRVSIDATVNGPFALERAWPVGTVDAQVKVESFSTAMVDGLAELGGDLKDLLGPHFDLALRVAGATPTAGELDLELDSQRSSLKLKGRFADNAFVSVGEPALVASIGATQGVLERRLAPFLPAGLRLVKGGAESGPCTVRVDNLVLPIPEGPLTDRALVRAALERVRCDLAIDLPEIVVDDEALRAANSSVGVRAKLVGSVAPGAPLVLDLDGNLMGGPSSGSTGKIAIHAAISDPWAVVTDGLVLMVDVDARIDDLPVRWIEAFVPDRMHVAGLIGDELDVHLSATEASLGTGRVQLTLRAPHVELDLAGRLGGGQFLSTGDEGLRLHATPPAGSVEQALAGLLPPGHELKVGSDPFDIRLSELALPLSTSGATAAHPWAAFPGRVAATLACKLPQLRWSDDTMRAAGASAELTGATLSGHLAQSGALDVTVRSTLDTGMKGELNLDVRVPDAWALALAQNLESLPPIDIALRVDRLPTALVETLAGMKGQLGEWIGPQISAGLEVKQANLTTGHVQLRVETPTLAAGLAGSLDGGVFKTAGEEGLRVRVQVARAPWDRVVGPRLPAGAEIGGALFSEPIELSVRNVSLAVPDFAAPSGARPLDALVQGLAADATLAIPGLTWSNAEMRAAKRPLALSKIALSAHVAPAAALDAKLAAELDAGAPGQLEASVTIADPWSLLRGGAALPPIDARVALNGLPTAVLETFIGPQPMLVNLVGPVVDVEISADDAALDRGSLRASVKSQTTSLTLVGHMQPGAFVCSGEEGLDLVVNLPNGFVESQISPKLPAGTRLALPADAGPLNVKVRNTRIALAAGSQDAVAVRDASAPVRESAVDPDTSAPAQSAADERAASALVDGSSADEPNAALVFLSSLGLELDASLPALAYSDAATDAGGKPVVLRDMRVSAELAPNAPPAASVTATIDGVEPGNIDISLRALDSLAKLAQPGGLGRLRVALDMRAVRVPTALVDLLARQDGLLLDTLGSQLELKAKSDGLSLDEGAFVVDLSSPQASLHAAGRMKDGTLSMAQTDRGVARFQLTPLASDRVVGSLVPMLFDVSKPAGADPVVLTLDELNYPIGGDLSNLDAIIHLNLGEVNYRMLPALDSMLGSLGQSKSVVIPNLVIPIRKGIATYDNLPITIGGKTCAFSGTFNLVDKTFKMSTEIPLAALGKKVNAALDGARDYLDPNLPVPIEISGTWKKPRVAIGAEFMNRVVEKAATGGLQDLLKGLGGKKKKKD